MLNSKLKLQGLTLEEIIHEGVHGNNPEVTIDDWKYIESLVAEDIQELLKQEYQKGFQEGEDHAWDFILSEEE